MSPLKFFIIASVVLVLTVFVIRYLMKKENMKISHIQKPKYKIFEGLILFDIDGTLTTGRENERVVQYCLDRGYAVGICTAGSMYNPGNLSRFEWMPRNLLRFMESTRFVTFNNIMNDIVGGESHNLDDVRMKYADKGNLIYGILKGYSLEKNSEKLDLFDYSNLYLVDNDPGFIRGMQVYSVDGSLKPICGGAPCGNVLTLESIKGYIH
jgi:hypothetical protein